MAGDDLMDHASSDQDFYALLSEGLKDGKTLHSDSTESEIKRAYRFTSLKWHPDKNPGPEAVEKFHLLGIAQQVLLDPAARAAYNNARVAKAARREREAQVQGKRREAMDDLFRREKDLKRKAGEEEDAEVRLQREMARLAENNRRMRKEYAEQSSRVAMKDEEEKRERERRKEAEQPSKKQVEPEGGEKVPELERMVTVRWIKDGTGEDVDQKRLKSMFGRFGEVLGVIPQKDKMRKVNGGGKKLMGSSTLLYKSIVGAYAAVEDSRTQKGPDWNMFESVSWLSGTGPEFLTAGGSYTPTETSPSADEMLTIRLKEAARKKREALERKEDVSNASAGPVQAAAPEVVYLPSIKTQQSDAQPASFRFSSSATNGSANNDLVREKQRDAERAKLEEQIRLQEAAEEAADVNGS